MPHHPWTPDMYMNIVFDNRKIGYIQKMCCRLHSMLVTASALRAAVGDQWLGGAAHLAPASCWPLAAVDTGPGTKSKKAARWRTGAGGGEWWPAHDDGQQQLSRKLETREETSPTLAFPRYNIYSILSPTTGVSVMVKQLHLLILLLVFISTSLQTERWVGRDIMKILEWWINKYSNIYLKIQNLVQSCRGEM